MKLSTLVPLSKRESPRSHCSVYHAGNPALFFMPENTAVLSASRRSDVYTPHRHEGGAGMLKF